jgi:TRAP-type C4-dicarboxylate transport system substrate-binding protein
MITTQLTRNTARVVVVAATIALLASCATPPGRSGAVDPVTLTTTWGNGTGGIGSDVLAELVNSSSDSPVSLSEPNSTSERDPSDEEGGALEDLASGEADISVVRADRLVAAGAGSLAPLQAPLVVTNNEQAAKIAADPVAKDLMSGLADIGLVGLALAPGGLRHPFGYKDALISPADYKGAVINVRTGPGVSNIVDALGATTDTSVGEDRTTKSTNGTLRGIEVSLQQAVAVDRPAVLTSNVVLYEKFDVVLIRAKAFEALTEPQRDALLAQVKKAISTATEARDTEESGFAAWCESSGASAESASQDDLAAIDAAMQPVLTKIKKGATAKKAIDRMVELRAGTTDSQLGTCSDPIAGTAEADFLVTPVGDQTVLDGVWRVEANPDDLEESGASFHDVQVNAGIWTFTTKDGLTSIDQPTGDDCEGQFAFDGDQISLNWAVNGNDSCYGHSKGTFVIEGKTAHITWETQPDYDVAQDNAAFKHGLVKVG